MPAKLKATGFKRAFLRACFDVSVAKSRPVPVMATLTVLGLPDE